MNRERTFLSINFHKKTVERFKGFCQKHGATYTDTVEDMMDFFDRYQLSPRVDYGKNLWDMEGNIKKRINAVIAIIKDVEKHQTAPTNAMIRSLFEQDPKAEEEEQPELLLAEATHFEAITKIPSRPEMELLTTRKDLGNLLSRIRRVSTGLGKKRLQLDMGLEEFEALKQTYKTN
ncbi:MAG: BfmA/BtgA family mobilization protein [Bacteroidota bacterium]